MHGKATIISTGVALTEHDFVAALEPRGGAMISLLELEISYTVYNIAENTSAASINLGNLCKRLYISSTVTPQQMGTGAVRSFVWLHP